MVGGEGERGRGGPLVGPIFSLCGGYIERTLPNRGNKGGTVDALPIGRRTTRELFRVASLVASREFRTTVRYMKCDSIDTEQSRCVIMPTIL